MIDFELDNYEDEDRLIAKEQEAESPLQLSKVNKIGVKASGKKKIIILRRKK